MNKYLYTVLCFFLCAFTGLVSAQNNVTVRVREAGTLRNQLSDDEWNKVTDLSVKGVIDGDDYVFLKSSRISHLDLSGVSLKRLPAKSFQGASNLQSIVLPDVLSSVGIGAFMKCKSLKKVVLPKNLTEIHSLAFAECESLNNIVLPKNLKVLESAAFFGCKSLKSFSIAGKNPNFKVLGGILYSDSVLVACPSGLVGTVLVPNFVKEIGNSAFGGCDSLSSILLPNTVKRIQDLAFWRCKSLKSVHLPDSLLLMGKGVFSSSGLSTFVWPFNIPTIPAETFKNCVNLTQVSLHLDLDSIHSNAFQGCVNLEFVDFPSGLRYLGEYAFNGCNKLKTINLNGNVISVGNGAFSSCAALENATLPSYMKRIPSALFSQCPSLVSISMPIGLEIIGKSAFNNCSSLKNVSWPISLREIEDGAFSGCKSLNNVDLPGGVALLGKSCFKSCSGLTVVSLPSTISEVPDEAFMNCEKLTELYLPKEIVGIGESAFRNCKNLNSLSLPSSLKVIGTGAFGGCTSLNTFQSSAMVAPKISASTFDQSISDNGLLYVPEEAIQNYKSAPAWKKFAVIMGNYVVKVPQKGLMSFMLTDSLWLNVHNISIAGELDAKDVSFLSDLLHRGSNIRVLDLRNVMGVKELNLSSSPKGKSNNSLRTIYLPKDLEEIAYGCFKDFCGLETVVAGECLKVIHRNAFANCARLSSMELPLKLQKIEPMAFVGCDRITNFEFKGSNYSCKDGVVFSSDGKTLVAYPAGRIAPSYSVPSSVTEIAEGAFATSKLQRVALPENLKTISDSAFAFCPYLVAAFIPGAVENVGVAAFYGDTSLMTVKLMDGVKSVSASAFYNCSELNMVVIPASVHAIGDFAFHGCSNIERFFNFATTPQVIKSNVFPKMTQPMGELYVPESAVSLYKGKTGWNKFATVIAH